MFTSFKLTFKKPIYPWNTIHTRTNVNIYLSVIILFLLLKKWAIALQRSHK